MIAAEVRLARDLVAQTLSLALLVGAIAALLTVVERASLEGVPALVARILPLLAAIAGARVALRWGSTGRVLALSSVGIAPIRLCAVAVVSGLFGAVVILGLVWSFSPPADSGREWFFVGEEWALSGDRVGDEVVGLRLARLEDGRVVGVGRADRARWVDHWILSGASGQDWSRGPRPLSFDLPAPQRWVDAMEWGAPGAIVQRMFTVLGSGLFCGLAMGLALMDRPRVGIAGAAIWVLISGAATAMVAAGSLSPGVALIVPVAGAGAACGDVSWRMT